MVKKSFLFRVTAILFFCMVASAQVTDDQKKYTAFDMRSNGKIYVVVTVMLIILIGLLLYVVRVDRKITRIENELNEKDRKAGNR